MTPPTCSSCKQPMQRQFNGRGLYVGIWCPICGGSPPSKPVPTVEYRCFPCDRSTAVVVKEADA